MMNWPLRNRNAGDLVVRKLNSRSVQWWTPTTFSTLKLLMSFDA